MRHVLLAIAGAVAFAATAEAQVATSASQGAPPPSLKSIGMIIYPAQKQTPEQQAKDEASCTQWAESQTGIKITGGQVDTKAAGEAAKSQAAEATTGAAVVGSAKGAAVGAAIGAISGDAGEGAAIGAVAGAVGGRRKKKQAEAQAEQQGAQQAQAQNKAAVDQFKKAAGACLTGRGYTVS